MTYTLCYYTEYILWMNRWLFCLELMLECTDYWLWRFLTSIKYWRLTWWRMTIVQNVWILLALTTIYFITYQVVTLMVLQSLPVLLDWVYYFFHFWWLSAHFVITNLKSLMFIDFIRIKIYLNKIKIFLFIIIHLYRSKYQMCLYLCLQIEILKFINEI